MFEEYLTFPASWNFHQISTTVTPKVSFSQCVLIQNNFAYFLILFIYVYSEVKTHKKFQLVVHAISSCGFLSLPEQFCKRKVSILKVQKSYTSAPKVESPYFVAGFQIFQILTTTRRQKRLFTGTHFLCSVHCYISKRELEVFFSPIESDFYENF